MFSINVRSFVSFNGINLHEGHACRQCIIHYKPEILLEVCCIRNLNGNLELNGITDSSSSSFNISFSTKDFLVRLDRSIFCNNGDILYNAKHMLGLCITIRQCRCCIFDEIVTIIRYSCFVTSGIVSRESIFCS